MKEKKIITLADMEEFKDYRPVDKTLGDVIDDASVNHPDVVAVVSGDERVTYSQLRSRTDLIAKGFIKLGIQKGEHVALLMPNIPEWMETAFALAKIGAIFVPCNTRFKKEELQYVINKSDASTLIMTSDFPEVKANYTSLICELAPELATSEPGKLNLRQLPAVRRVVILGKDVPRGCYSFDDVLAMGRDVSDETLKARQNQVKPNDTATIIFTSGTTGFPKGCVLRHSPLITATTVLGMVFKMTEKDVVLLPVGLFTIYGLGFSMMTTFIKCATLLMEKVFDPGEMLELIEKERVTVLVTVPTMITMLFEHPNFTKTDFSSLRTGNIGGAYCPPELMRRARSDKKGWGLGCRGMCSCYGMTETHTALAIQTLDDPEDKALYTVGRVCPLIKVRVVDPQTGEDMPVGGEGELLIGGSCVMTEYYKEPQQTADKVENGWLHTGDMVVIDEDGYIRITGRVTDMILIGGFNLYPKEIENVILQHPKVMDVSAFRVPDKVYGEVPAVHIILKPNTSMDEAELVKYCKNNMAGYKVPKYVKFVREFPLNPMGKVQKDKQTRMTVEELRLE